jgi:hypothetical protein
MERPTSALHLTRVTLCLRDLNAEPHTKEVGRDDVYYHPFVSAALRQRQQGAPAAIIAQAWTAQPRLHGPYQRFAARRKPKQHTSPPSRASSPAYDEITGSLTPVFPYQNA